MAAVLQPERGADSIRVEALAITPLIDSEIRSIGINSNLASVEVQSEFSTAARPCEVSDEFYLLSFVCRA